MRNAWSPEAAIASVLRNVSIPAAPNTCCWGSRNRRGTKLVVEGWKISPIANNQLTTPAPDAYPESKASSFEQIQAYFGIHWANRHGVLSLFGAGCRSSNCNKRWTRERFEV
jgi:hypothetical protein